MLASKPPLRVTVIGAGAFGGWTALHLRRRGADVTLLDAWGPGNSRASSGGETRVIRAIYGKDRVYVEMVKRAYELWEQLGRSLYVETGTLWMHRGDDAYVRGSAPILRDLGFPLEQLSLAEAKKRWPQIAFNGIQSVWLERRAGALLARQACSVVRDAFVEAGGTYRVEQVQPSIVESKQADVYVFACGPWLGKLFPGIPIEPTRQEVHFFGTPAGPTSWKTLPIWIDFGERIFYGIPDTHGRGFKVADDTRGAAIDPTTLERTPSNDSVSRARKLLAERFPGLANAPVLESRVCQYENSPDGHLILDRHPNAPNVWIAGGGSGHGFKLGPAVGELLADAITKDREIPPLFRLARLQDGKRSTQWTG
ncbi:MAG TPA: FAD-dependent oxidoreductase [Thermoanaerobaculia bacterium]|nr:FAD-dependent oxidoreductase [Thermoanaerobaculia bacterium]